jgi:hypothetical protein
MSKIEPVATVVSIRTHNFVQLAAAQCLPDGTKLYATDPNPLLEMIERLAVALEDASRMLGTYGEPLDGDVILLYEAREMLK